MEQLTIMANDRVGLLAEVTSILGQSNINIDMLSAEVSEGKAVIMLATSDPARAREILQAGRFATSIQQVEAVKPVIRFHPLAVLNRSDGIGRPGGDRI